MNALILFAMSFISFAQRGQVDLTVNYILFKEGECIQLSASNKICVTMGELAGPVDLILGEKNDHP